MRRPGLPAGLRAGIWRDFRGDRAGAVAILFALGAFMLFGFGAMAVDVGSFFYAKRRQQTANDLAAIAAASDLPKAWAAARASAAANGFAAATLQRVEPGIYTADSRLTVEERFQPAPPANANAVRVTMRSTTPLLLGRVVQAARADAGEAAPGEPAAAGGDIVIASRAVAMRDAHAAFAIGSRLARFEGGVLNGVLGALLGSTLSLSAMDYEALARARIDLFTFSRKLATRAGLTAATYDEVLQAPVRLPELMLAAQDAAREQAGAEPAATAALGALAARTSGSPARLSLAPLVSFGAFGTAPLAGPGPIAASLGALDLVSALAQIANGTRQVETGLAVSLPGIAAARLRLGIGERPVGSPLVAAGRAGASVHTAQTRLLLTLDLVGSGLAAGVRLPLYLELAAATARLAAVQCTPGEVTSARVTLAVTPALVDAWVGQVSNAEFGNFTRAPSPPPALLLNLAGIARVTGRAHATMTNLAETPVSFSHAQILRAEKRTTSTQNFTATLLGRLFGDLDVKVEALGLGLGTSGLGQAVGASVSAAATPIDTLLTAVLGTLGLGLGQADSWVGGVRCGGAVLVR